MVRLHLPVTSDEWTMTLFYHLLLLQIHSHLMYPRHPSSQVLSLQCIVLVLMLCSLDEACTPSSGRQIYLVNALRVTVIFWHSFISSSLLIVTSHRTFLHSGHDARTAAREDGKRGVAGLALSDTTPQPLQTSLAQQIRTHYSASTTPAPRWQCAVVIHATCALVSVQWKCRTVLTSLTPTR
jgi:hypothetical protein